MSDECGFLLMPYRRRTWAPRGQTPVLAVSARHHRRVSAIGALALSPKRKRIELHFQLSRQGYRKAEVIAFLYSLHRTLRRKAIVIWDRLNAHRSAAAYFAQHHPEWFEFEFLPAYSPQLNPIEQCWSHTKCHDLANDNRHNVDELEQAVQAKLSAKRRRHKLFKSFFEHAGLKL